MVPWKARKPTLISELYVVIIIERYFIIGLEVTDVRY